VIGNKNTKLSRSLYFDSETLNWGGKSLGLE